jgi:hypothetical protein
MATPGNLPPFSFTASSIGITDNSTSGFGYDPANLYLSDGTTLLTTTWENVVQKILNLSAVKTNIQPNELVINDTIIIDNDDIAPTEIIVQQAGTNGAVGSLFGLSYDSATNQDFVIQTDGLNSGGVLFKQFGVGATTTQTKITNGTITINDTDIANPETAVIQHNSFVINTAPTSTNQSLTTILGGQAIVQNINTTDPDPNLHTIYNTEISPATIVLYQQTQLSPQISKQTILNSEQITYAENGSIIGTKTWANIVAGGSQTYDQVLNTGNTATDKTAVITGTGGIGTTTSSTNKGSFSIIETDGSVINQTSLLYSTGLTITDQTNALTSYFRSIGAYFSNISATIYSTLTNGALTFVGSPVSNSSLSASSLVFIDTNAGASSASLQSTSLSIQSPLTGYTSNPYIQLINLNATAGATTGVPSVEYFKSGRNAVATDVIASNNFYANNYAGTKTQFAKIEASVRNTASGNDDGSIGMFATLNGVLSEFFRVNGADGENNSFYPIDMNNQAIKSSTGNLTLSATASTGNGDITLGAKRNVDLTAGTTGGINGTTTNGNISFIANTPSGGVNGFCSMTADRGIALSSAQGGSDGNIVFDTNSIGDLQFVGTNLQSPTSGGSAGTHLRIKLNGTFYKIALLID